MSETASTAETESPPTDERVEDLRAQVELLQAENDRLRQEYRRARQTSYRRTAAGLGIVGVVAVLGAALFPAVRDVLIVLGAIGLFGGVLTRYLTPERFVSAETGERIYAAHAETLGALEGQLGLEDRHIYVPIDGMPPARLFVPQHQEYAIPDRDALEQPLVVGEDAAERGVSVIPTGGTLFREFERSLTGSVASTPTAVTEQVADALVEGFELTTDADSSVDAEAGRVTVEFEGSVYSDASLPDNPLGSLLAVALSRSLGQPVQLETARTEAGLVVTCQWEAEAVETTDTV
jgi:hypothetical protein